MNEHDLPKPRRAARSHAPKDEQRVQFSISREKYAALEELAKANNLGVADVMRHLVDGAIGTLAAVRDEMAKRGA